MPHLASVLALPFAGPLHSPPVASDGTITNGPYRVLARRPGENIELVRNHRFHAADAVAVERVTYLTLDDLNTELNLYRSGRPRHHERSAEHPGRLAAQEPAR